MYIRHKRVWREKMNNMIEFKHISRKDLPQMTKLLMERQNIEKNFVASLSNSCLNKDYISKTLEKLLDTNKVVGVGAFVDDELLGYLFGEIIDSTRVGRYASVVYEGVAVREDQPYELIRLMYSHVSVLWLEQGCYEHSILLPVGNKKYYESFMHLSFAIQQVHAVMSIKEYVPFDINNNITIRFATEKDRETLGKLSSIISMYQNSSPSFLKLIPEVMDRIKEGFEGLVDGEDIVFIAERANQALGFQVYEKVPLSLMLPDDVINLEVAGTYASQMRSGVGKQLMNEGCKILKSMGYKYIKTDWRITNLSSSTFWPKCGFKNVAYRMSRSIDKDYELLTHETQV